MTKQYWIDARDAGRRQAEYAESMLEETPYEEGLTKLQDDFNELALNRVELGIITQDECDQACFDFKAYTDENPPGLVRSPRPE